MFSPKSAEKSSVGSTEGFRNIETTIGQYSYESHKQPLKQTINLNKYKWDIAWRTLFMIIIVHLIAAYGVWLILTQAMWSTAIFGYLYAVLCGLGITAGAHRLWAHRTYKAKLPLRIFLMLCQSAALQNHIYEWVRDHRAHHKFTDTDADPHNSRRGFFFSHMGWLMVRKHKDVIVKGKTVDMSDLEADDVVVFQKRYYALLGIIFCFLIPAFIPWYFWGEGWWASWYIAGFAKYVLVLHFTWLVNSAAHIYGTKPYDIYINPRENRFVAWAALGEGWHNYHHVFPRDYKAAELGNYRLNLTTAFLDFMAKVGWAYDLQTVSPDIIMQRAQKTGEISRYNGSVDHYHRDKRNILVWGRGDKDFHEKYIDDVQIPYKLTTKL